MASTVCSTLALRLDATGFVADVVVLSIVAVDRWRATFAHEPFPDDLKSSFNAPFCQKYCPSPMFRREMTPTTAALCFFGADVCKYRICSRCKFFRQRKHTDRVSMDFKASMVRGRPNIALQWQYFAPSLDRLRSLMSENCTAPH